MGPWWEVTNRMALRADVAAMLADAGMPDAEVDEAVEDEHVRVRVYGEVVAAVAASRRPDAERRIVALILRDPVSSVAKTAVVQLVDEVAMRSAGPGEFQRWAAGLLPELRSLDAEGHGPFVRRRVHDWSVYLAIEDGRTPAAAELAGTTPWMQRMLAEKVTSLPVLTLLAEGGGTRKIRNIAGRRADALMRGP
jgi:pimeloyl-ACP methyl ester carboxylesterase